MSEPERQAEINELPSYFQDNPWVEILSQRGQEDGPSMGPVRAPGASASPALSTAQMSPGLETQPGPPASQAPQPSMDLSQLISAFVKLVQGQVQVAHAQAQAQPMVMVIPIVVQVPVPYPWPIQAQSAEIGGRGGVLCTPRPNWPEVPFFHAGDPGSNPGGRTNDVSFLTITDIGASWGS